MADPQAGGTPLLRGTARVTFAFALTNLFALERDRFHPPGQRVRRKQGHRDRQHRRDRGNTGKDHRDQPGIVHDGDDGLEHVGVC